MWLRIFAAVAALSCCVSGFASLAFAERATHALSLFGEPKYGASFRHFQYADPAAAKGGKLRLCRFDSFDSLNPFDVKAKEPFLLQDLVFERLMSPSRDEPFSVYATLAKSVTLSADRRTMRFELDERARFEDGRPVTPLDVLFSLKVLREHGRPNVRFAYKNVTARSLGEREVEFSLPADAPWELPLIVAWMSVLPSHHYDAETFGQSGLRLPLGSGPYEVISARPGDQIVYRRKPKFWGADLPVNRGRFNFDEISVTYFRNKIAAFEAFKAGDCDVFDEADPAKWNQAYDFPARERGDVIKAEFEKAIPAGMSAIVLNTRRPMFADVRVRKAIAHVFDAEFVNKNHYAGLYRRTESFFDGSRLASIGQPPTEQETAILAPFKADLDADFVAGQGLQPVNDGTGRDRRNAKRAFELLQEAGYVQRVGDNAWIHKVTGAPLAFTFLAANLDQVRLANYLADKLRTLGIAMQVREMETVSLQRVRTEFDFDAMHFFWSASLSPGNEQTSRWSSASADVKGSFNLAGVKSPAVDAALAAMLKARDQASYLAGIRALDRALLSGYYVVPLFHARSLWVAHWRHIRYPGTRPDQGYQLDTWWTVSQP